MADTNKDFTSSIDPTRETYGAIYNKAQQEGEKLVEIGDMSRELTNSLVDDLNETIASNPYDGEIFYITVYEKKDLQMPNSILRRLYTTKYRPYPEDDTIVFKVNPKNQHLDFCWCIPHHTEMLNVITNVSQFDKALVDDVLAWRANDLKHFGFDIIKTKDNKRMPVPSKENRDQPLNYSKISVAVN